MTVKVIDVDRIGCHWHDALEVVWVLSGEIYLKESNMPYFLKQGDIYVVNYNETHRIKAINGNATVMFLYFDYRYFQKYIPNLNEISYEHYCFSTNLDLEDALTKCRAAMKELYPLLTLESAGSVIEAAEADDSLSAVESLAQSFIKLLINTFQYTHYTRSGDSYRAAIDKSPNLSKEQIKRLHTLTHYIYMNSNEKLTLSDVAESVFYSKFYISHFIKKAYGLNFQETLCLSRVTISERLLIGTDYTMDNIAEIVGFSTRNQYCHQFKKWHGVTPSQFRKENSPDNPENTDIISPSDVSKIKSLI